MSIRRTLNVLPPSFAILAIIGLIITSQQMVEPQSAPKLGLTVFVIASALAALTGLIAAIWSLIHRRFDAVLVLNLMCGLGFSGLLAATLFVVGTIGFRL